MATITYTVTVASGTNQYGTGNKFYINGEVSPVLYLQEGNTYIFDQSNSSNAVGGTHVLAFSTTANGTHAVPAGTAYTTGVTTTGTPGSSGAQTVITVAASAPTLYYQCSSHAGMGGQANTNSTFGSSNFAGSIQSTVSAGSTQAFSIVSYTGNGSAGATIGHGLGATPGMIIQKIRSSTGNWLVYHHKNTSAPETDFLRLNTTDATADEATIFNDTAPTSSVFSVGTENTINGNGVTCIAYCFAEKKGYSKFGSYTGNGNADGAVVYTGFKPAWVLGKRTDSANNWYLFDTVRDPFNLTTKKLRPDTSAAENDNSSKAIDILSNGFKIKNSDAEFNASSGTYIYMAFAEEPLVANVGQSIPATAR